MNTVSINNPTTSYQKPPVAGRRVWRWLRLGLLGALALIVGLAAVGFTVQKILEGVEARRYPAPGQMVEVDGVALHLLVTGRPGNGPTVILEAGSSGFSSQWVHIQEAVSEYTQVVAYDRMGLGWSEDSDQPRDAVSAAQRLHAALEHANIDGPYLLVGHSLGGFFIRTFADQYPDEVAGMVMIDASHPDQRERFGPEMRKMQDDWTRMFQIGAKLAPFGLMRVMPSQEAMLAGLPEPQIAESLAISMKPSYLQATYEEIAAWDVMAEQVRQTGSLSDMPLVVLSATEDMDFPNQREVWHGNHAELAGLSTRGEHRLVEGANHFGIIMDPVLAQTAIDAIADVHAAAVQ